MNVAKDPGADGVLETIEKSRSETGGFVEADATGRSLGVLIHLDGLEQTIHDADVKVEMGIERRAEAVKEAGGCE